MKLKWIVLGSAVAVGAVSGVTVVGCGGDTVVCSLPARLSDDGKTCLDVNDDLAAVAPAVDLAGQGPCGTNTVLMNGSCVPTSAICQAQGTVFDPQSFSCKPDNPGTLLGSLNFTRGFQHIFGQFPNG